MVSVQLGNAEAIALRGRLVFNARRLVSCRATAEDLEDTSGTRTRIVNVVELGDSRFELRSIRG